MIDIHCHILPGIDDGAKDLPEALALLRMAIDDGITRMVLTPHLHIGRFDNTNAVIEPEYLALKQAAIDEGLTIELAFSAEVRLDSDILALIVTGKLPMYGVVDGQQFMLLELPHSHIPVGSEELVKFLKHNKITPVIAHPERNRDLLKSPHKIKQFSRLGCWFQITAGSIVGQFGEKCQQLALYYLEQGLIDVVASDAHNIKRRPPILSTARMRVVELLGEQQAQQLFYDNPYKITATLFE